MTTVTEFRGETWEEFAKYMLQHDPTLIAEQTGDPWLDDCSIAGMVEQPGFEQMLLDFARQSFTGIQDPRLGGLLNELSHRAVLGDDWSRSFDLPSGQWELDAMNISFRLSRMLKASWDSPDGRVALLTPLN